jgi:hypothetical protein
MRDESVFRDHRLEAAKATGCRQAAARGWNFAATPAPESVPGFVWKFLAWAFGLTVFFVFTPVIVRALMS